MGLDKWALKGKNTLIKLIGLFYVLEGAAFLILLFTGYWNGLRLLIFYLDVSLLSLCFWFLLQRGLIGAKWAAIVLGLVFAALSALYLLPFVYVLYLFGEGCLAVRGDIVFDACSGAIYSFDSERLRDITILGIALLVRLPTKLIIPWFLIKDNGINRYFRMVRDGSFIRLKRR